MNADRDAAPDDVAALKAALAAERAKGLEVAAELAVARAPALVSRQKSSVVLVRPAARQLQANGRHRTYVE